ncbi:hypothetical protein M413DRAFT_449528 [Hebeloma cylindrosporum]|uniref:Uncharacterized protein n=1 Tax=Hebeloma cylindrosporum TaxID=76867 RepID=A0A0C3BGP5_HEBCY|nr:hypothetical protein M413DRAFT_449528 [Hebeloma cylindrosporum h7]
MAIFLDFVNRFFEARMEYYSQHNEQGRHFNGRPKANANKLIELGTTAYREGVAVSTAGSSTKSSCKIYHHNPPKDSEGRCLLCFADLPLSEPQAGTGAFLSWEAYLNTFEREDILRAMNQDSQVIEGSPGAPETTHTVESTGGNYLGLESVSESEIPSMWRSFTSLFTPRRRGGESAGQ